MHLDVVELRRFYSSTQLGRMAQRIIREGLRTLWPDVKGETVLGFGFAAPFLAPFLAEAKRTICLMPAQQGVCAWPSEGPNVSVLMEETLWPLPGGFADRLVVAHGLETCERPSALLDEIWRVLAPGGKAVFIVPNRAGMWARRDGNPFSYGRPYSAGQLDDVLTAHKFTVERQSAALYMPPSQRRFWLRTGPAIEKLGQRLDARRLSGVLMIEVEKMVYITPQSGARASARDPIRVLTGLGAPVPKPAGRSARM